MIQKHHRTIAGGRVALGAAALFGAALTIAGCHGRVGAGDPPGDTGAAGEAGTKLISFEGGRGLEMGADGIKLANVTTVVAGKEDVGQSVEPTGEVAPTDAGTIQVTSRLPGRVVQAFVSVGSQVKKGQLIAQVDSVDLTQAQAAYQTALAHERLTAHQLEQQKRLARYGTLDEPALEDANRTFAAAQAAVHSDEAQLQLDRVTLQNTQKLVDLGEITRKPVDDAQNAYAAAQAALAQARVNLHSAKSSYDRANILFKSGVFAKQQFEDAETAYNNATAAVDQATTQEKLAGDELQRQKDICKQNLNGASSMQTVQSKLQQDQHTYQNDLTALSLAKRALTRATAVRKSGIPVSQALQQAEDADQEAQTALQGAANTVKLYGVNPGTGVSQLANGHVVIPVFAPLDGIVTQRSMAVGQMTDTSTPLVKIVNLDRVYVDAQVYEKDLTDVAAGSPVSLRVAAFPNRPFTGKVSYIGREVNPDTRTITVRTEIGNPGWLLRPGMFATVHIGSRGVARALAVPEQAVFQEGDSQEVYVQVAPQQFVKRDVKIGAAVSGKVPVYGGLQAGDRVVVNGNLFLESEQQKLESEKRGSA